MGQRGHGDCPVRVRALSASGDFQFGQSQANFIVNSPAMVEQLVTTRLRLLQGEWFLDTTIGMPWIPDVLGVGTVNIYDKIIQAQVLSTPGMTPGGSIAAYQSSLTTPTRMLTVSMTLITSFGPVLGPNGQPSQTILPLRVGGPFILNSGILGGGSVLG